MDWSYHSSSLRCRRYAARACRRPARTYGDGGISASKGRDGRPGFDRMVKVASKRRYDIVMAWAIDRLGGP
jgi:DNA invertase Pin-like site-specific DNA recombinase